MRTVIYGSRPDGHARVVIELLAEPTGLEIVGLIDDEPPNADRTVAGVSVLGTGEDLPRLADEGIEAVVLGFGAGLGRCRVIEQVLAAGLALPTLIHSTATLAASARFGTGCQLLPGAIVGPGVTLGRGVLVNSGAIIEHDCRLDDGAVLYSGAVLAGRVGVGPEAEIGAGATIVPDVQIGARCRVGAGAAVIEDLGPDITAIGVPARPPSR